MSLPLVIEVYRNGPVGSLQVSIGFKDSGGYRLTGPKFTGQSTLLRSHELDQRDADQIRAYLDQAFPRT